MLKVGPKGTLSTNQSFHPAGTTSDFFKSPILHSLLFTELPAEIILCGFRMIYSSMSPPQIQIERTNPDLYLLQTADIAVDDK